MKRMFYLTHSIESADTIARDLHDAGIAKQQIHVLGGTGTALEEHHLKPANIFQRTDIVRSIERALLVACLMSILFTLPLNYIEAFTFNAWLGISAFCLAFCLIAGTVSGLAQENCQIYRFHRAVSEGQYLIMIDISEGQAPIVRRVMGRQHPEASMEGAASLFVNPFSPTYESSPIKL